MRLSLLWLAKRRYAVGAIAIIAGTLISPTRVIAQTQQYMVRELSGDDATGVPFKLNNLGDIAGRAGSAIAGETRGAVWNHANFRPW